MDKTKVLGIIGIVLCLVAGVDYLLSFFDCDFLPWYLNLLFVFLGLFLGKLGGNDVDIM